MAHIGILNLQQLASVAQVQQQQAITQRRQDYAPVAVEERKAIAIISAKETKTYLPEEAVQVEVTEWHQQYLEAMAAISAATITILWEWNYSVLSTPTAIASTTITVNSSNSNHTIKNHSIINNINSAMAALVENPNRFLRPLASCSLEQAPVLEGSMKATWMFWPVVAAVAAAWWEVMMPVVQMVMGILVKLKIWVTT